MSMDRILGGLARRLGVEPFQPEADGSYHLSFDHQLQVRLFQHGRNDLYLVGRIGRLPGVPYEAEQRLREVLSRSLALMRERSEVVCLEPETDELLLYRRLELDRVDPAGFPDQLAEFLEQLEIWSGRSAPSRPLPSPMTMIRP